MRPYRHRWQVELTFAWRQNCRRLVVGWERDSYVPSFLSRYLHPHYMEAVLKWLLVLLAFSVYAEDEKEVIVGSTEALKGISAKRHRGN